MSLFKKIRYLEIPMLQVMGKQFVYSTINLLLVSLFFVSCQKQNVSTETNECDTTNVTYTLDVLPVIQSKCVGCHHKGVSRYTLNTYESIASAATSGKLIATINHAPGASAMPKLGEKLDPCTISKIEKWVNDGALNN